MSRETIYDMMVKKEVDFQVRHYVELGKVQVTTGSGMMLLVGNPYDVAIYVEIDGHPYWKTPKEIIRLERERIRDQAH